MMMSVGDFEEMIELTPVEERKTRKRKFDETRSKPKKQTTLLNFFKKKIKFEFFLVLQKTQKFMQKKYCQYLALLILA